MTRRGLARAVHGAFAVLVAAVAAGAGQGPVTVAIREPVAGQPAMGSVEVVASVISANAVARVELLVDGRPAAILTAPPWRATLDIGTENRRHGIRVVALDVLGNAGEASVVTEPIPDGGRFGVTLQQQYVTVTRDGRRVLDLDAGSFAIRDDGVRQDLVTFARGDIPFTAVLLIDASSSMVGERLAAASRGVRGFVEGCAELDQVSLVAFSDRLLERTPFGNRPDVLEDALSRLRPGQGTALHDHLYAALKLLEQRQGRRVVVLLSDGVDSHSVLEMEDVRRAIRRSQALVYWVWLGSAGHEFDDGRLRGVFSTWRTTDEYRRQFELLRESVLDSGGRIVPVAADQEIEPVFVDVLAELREQYVLGFYPTVQRDDGSWHEVSVGVREGGLEVRTASGYVDY